MKIIDISEAYIKFGTKLFHLNDLNEEKIWNVRSHGESERKVNLGVLGMNLYVSNGVA